MNVSSCRLIRPMPPRAVDAFSRAIFEFDDGNKMERIESCTLREPVMEEEAQ